MRTISSKIICILIIIMSSANIFGYLNILHNTIMKLENRISALEVNKLLPDRSIDKSADKIDALFESKKKEFEDIITKIDTKIDTKLINKLDSFEAKMTTSIENSLKPKIENIVNKRIDITNENIFRQIKNIHDQINNILKQTESLDKNQPIIEKGTIDFENENNDIIVENKVDTAKVIIESKPEIKKNKGKRILI